MINTFIHDSQENGNCEIDGGLPLDQTFGLQLDQTLSPSLITNTFSGIEQKKNNSENGIAD